MLFGTETVMPQLHWYASNHQNLTGWSPLMVAAANGDADLVHELVEHSYGLLTRRKETALMVAVKGGSLPCVRLLAKAEAKARH